MSVITQYVSFSEMNPGFPPLAPGPCTSMEALSHQHLQQHPQQQQQHQPPQQQSQALSNTCGVCGAEAKCFGFTVYVCKACSVFYRRNWRLARSSKCRRTGNCDLGHERRNTCKACRLQMCRKLGLRMVGRNLVVQHDGYPVDDVSEEEAEPGPEPSSSHAREQEPSPPNSQHSNEREEVEEFRVTSRLLNTSLRPKYASTVENYPELNRITQDFMAFEDRQKSIVAKYLGLALNETNTQQQTRETCPQIEYVTMRIACIFIAQVLRKCQLSPDEKRKMYSASILQTATAHKLGVSARQFPGPNDRKAGFYIGAHYEVDHMENFTGPNKTERLSVIKPLFTYFFEATQRLKKANPDFVECVVLATIPILEELHRQSISNASVKAFIKEVYREIFEYLSGKLGDPVMAATRMTRITSFLFDVRGIMALQTEMWTMLDVFMFEPRENYWIPPKGNKMTIHKQGGGFLEFMVTCSNLETDAVRLHEQLLFSADDN